MKRSRETPQLLQVHDDPLSTQHDVNAPYGGEEFLVLLPNFDVSEAVSVAERIRGHVLAAALPNPGSQVKSVVTLSVGMAYGNVASIASETLQERADAALYFAKRSGNKPGPFVEPWDGFEREVWKCNVASAEGSGTVDVPERRDVLLIVLSA